MGRVRHPPNADKIDRGIALILGLGGLFVILVLGGIAIVTAA